MTVISDKRPGGSPSKFRTDFCVRVVELMAEGRSLDECAALMGARRPTSLGRPFRGPGLQAPTGQPNPQSNGIVERLHRTLLDEHFRVEGRRTWFETIDEMQKPLDEYLAAYNAKRPHQGRGMNGRTPARAFIEGIPKSAPEKGGDKTAKTNQKHAA